MCKKSDWSVLGLSRKNRMRRFQRYLQQGKRTSGRRPNSVPRQQMCQNGHNAVRKACGNLGGVLPKGGILPEERDGAGKRVMECEMCTENDKEGRGWERQWQ
jgi:hypothetical protein